MDKKIDCWLAMMFLVLFYFLPPAQARSESRTLTVHINVEPVFVVEVAPRAGGSDILEFGTLKKIHSEDAQTEPVQVDVTVISNLGVPYEVAQTVTGPLTNESGEFLNLENFMVQTESAIKGSGRYLAPSPVASQPQVLFESNGAGESDRFTANYTLQVPAGQMGGDYQTNIVYTIVTRE